MTSPATELKLTRRQKTIFAVLTCVLVYGVIELMALAAYVLVTDYPFSFSTLQNARNTVLHQTLSDDADKDPILSRYKRNFVRIPNMVIHPYVGFVGDAQHSVLNEYGLHGPPSPVNALTENQDTVFVAILGGSVANGFYREGGEALARALEQVSALSGKHVQPISLAFPGMKQPQQLMMLNYFMALGARYDLVINLDGFNELVLPIVENMRQETSPFYPRGWKRLVHGVTDRAMIRLAGHIHALGERQIFWARLFSVFPLRYSVTANLIWDRLNTSLWLDSRELYQVLHSKLRDQDDALRPGATFAETGPRQHYDSDQEKYRAMAAFWKHSSILIDNLGKGNDFLYFHFLQPNQYVPDSKLFTEKELKIAFTEDHPYRKTATEGYPYLIEAGRELKEAGINFTDLTMLFEGSEEVMYTDDCCHFNRRANLLMAQEMARVIGQRLGAQAWTTP